MKTIRATLLLLLFLFGLNAFSQKTFNSGDVFTEKDMVWFGLDFTHCKFIGQPAIHGNFYKEPAYVVKYFFRDWNMIPLKEVEKYNIKGQFDKEYVYFDMDTVMERNRRYNPDSLIAFSKSYKLNTLEIPNIISTYGGITKEGIGIAYIVETFDHETDQSSIYCVVFDIATKKILLQENIKAKASGGSLKTFWAGAIRETLEKNHKVYRKWKKAAMVK